MTFACVDIYVILHHPSASTPSLTKCYAIEHDFFFNTDVGIDELTKMYRLSPKTYDGESQGISIIRNLYRRPLKYSQHSLITMNSYPKELVIM